ncbi:MAG: nitroreductase family protein [Anaerolineae bacterium]|nr:nitroreductase family protein [Anaerolineae bacterium]
MDLLDAIRRRRTTNNKFAPDPVKPEHIRLLIEAASRSPSHFNSQPWRFVIVRDKDKLAALADLAGASMKELMEGEFFARYKRYFRFDDQEADGKRDGIYIDHMPAVLRPFIKQVFTPNIGKLLGTFGVSKMLGGNQAEIVRESPLILAVAMNKEEYKPGELAGLYSTISLGAVIQTFWLVTTSLNMGMQFISTPLEVPERKALIAEMLKIPPTFELVALFRMGYKAEDAKRNSIDWTSSQRKPFEELASVEEWGAAMPGDLAQAESILFPEKAPDARD